jgi:hypothetical protein
MEKKYEELKDAGNNGISIRGDMTMTIKTNYEEYILNEIRELPEEILPKVARLLSLIKEEFIAIDKDSEVLDESINHQKTRDLLSTSKINWAHSIITDREDRL